MFGSVLGKNTILPIPNPTGNPYQKSYRDAKIHDQGELKGLQVKAVLNKLGDVPRSYSELIALADGENVEMDMANLSVSSRPRIGDRFAKIEKARQSITLFTVSLANKLDRVRQNGDGQPKDMINKRTAAERLQKRAEKTGRNPRKFKNKE